MWISISWRARARGADRERLLEALASLKINGVLIPELKNYLETDLDRFMYTVGLVPGDAVGRALEIGANPYFASALMQEHRPELTFEYLNYFEGRGDRIAERVEWTDQQGKDRTIHADCFNINVEVDRIPVEDGRYDLILFCEVLEHFTMDPMRALRELSRVLKPEGMMVLTTPNVARMENVIAFLEGRNIYDPYSGYGPHGRHNREYSRHELHMLLRHAGFTCEFDFTSDVHAHAVPGQQSPAAVLDLLRTMPHRENDLGQYLFSRWIKTSEPQSGLPRWLYRSYPEDTLA